MQEEVKNRRGSKGRGGNEVQEKKKKWEEGNEVYEMR
jgi:hypothetical protein